MTDPQPLFGRVLLTNDDGIDAPGLQVLEAVAAALAREVWVVAPEHDRSGVAQAISLHDPLRCTAVGERRHALSGTPADCVVFALRHLMREAPPELVLSGINRGANLGVETVYSGTVGAALTAVQLGLPAFALSLAFGKGTPVRWQTAAELAPAVLRRLWPMVAGQAVCLNVNFPDCAAEAAGPLTLTRQGVGMVQGIEIESRTDPRQIAYHWPRFERGPRPDVPDAEAVVVQAGGIAVTPLRLDRTDTATADHLRPLLARGAA